MSLSKQTDACTRDSRARIVMDTPSAPSFSLDTKSWHEDCRSTHSSVRPRRSHSSVPTAIQLRCRVERRSRMAAAWRPPEGLVLDGREHGGRLWRGGEEGDHRRLWLPASASRVTLQRLGSGSWKPIKNPALGPIRKRDPAQVPGWAAGSPCRTSRRWPQRA